MAPLVGRIRSVDRVFFVRARLSCMGGLSAAVLGRRSTREVSSLSCLPRMISKHRTSDKLRTSPFLPCTNRREPSWNPLLHAPRPSFPHLLRPSIPPYRTLCIPASLFPSFAPSTAGTFRQIGQPPQQEDRAPGGIENKSSSSTKKPTVLPPPQHRTAGAEPEPPLHPEISPLTTLEELLEYERPGWGQSFAPARPLPFVAAPFPPLKSRLLVCHDYAGGYGEDRLVQGGGYDRPYRMYDWGLIDIFVYFRWASAQSAWSTVCSIRGCCCKRPSLGVSSRVLFFYLVVDRQGTAGS